MAGDPADPMAAARAAMVSRQLRERGIADERVLEVMARLPREEFLPSERRAQAYDDAALPVASGQTISQPYMVAWMTELLGVEADDRILDVGTGTGYQAAVLASLGAHVVSLERRSELADDARRRLDRLGFADAIEVRLADGSLGAEDGAPWDGIVVGAAAPSIPDALREQLAVGARLVIPVGSRDRQELLCVERKGPNDWIERSGGACVFVPLVGAAGFAERSRRGAVARWWRGRSRDAPPGDGR